MILSLLVSFGFTADIYANECVLALLVTLHESQVIYEGETNEMDAISRQRISSVMSLKDSVIQTLGSGGDGSVYRVFPPDGRAPITVKVFHSNSMDDTDTSGVRRSVDLLDRLRAVQLSGKTILVPELTQAKEDPFVVVFQNIRGRSLLDLNDDRSIPESVMDGIFESYESRLKASIETMAKHYGMTQVEFDDQRLSLDEFMGRRLNLRDTQNSDVISLIDQNDDYFIQFDPANVVLSAESGEFYLIDPD